jgi:hypothetical protein
MTELRNRDVHAGRLHGRKADPNRRILGANPCFKKLPFMELTVTTTLQHNWEGNGAILHVFPQDGVWN